MNFRYRFYRKIFSLISFLSIFFQSFYPYLAVIPVARAQEETKAELEYNADSNKFKVSVNTKEPVKYFLVYRSADKNEVIEGESEKSDKDFEREFYAGICSAEGTCVPDQVLRGILKIEVASENFQSRKEFIWENNNIKIVEEEDSVASFELTDAEKYWLETGLEFQPTVTPTPAGEILDEAASIEKSVTPTIISLADEGEIETEIIETYQCFANSLNECVVTDKEDYHPNEVVFITGHGFIPNSPYILVITSETGPLSVNFDIMSDENGSFEYSYQLDGTYRPNYSVFVYDTQDNLVAQTSFTDSVITLHNNVTLEQWRPSSGGDWITGALNSSNSDYKEGETVPFRLNLGVNQVEIGTTYQFSICRNYEKDTIKGYYSINLFNANRALTNAQIGGVISHTNGPISGVNVIINSVQEVNGQGACGAGDRETIIQVTKNNPTAYVLWGGKLASPSDYGVGVGNGASQYSGGSLHMKLLSPSKDLSINPAGIIELSSITVTKVVDSGNATPDQWCFNITPDLNSESPKCISTGQNSVVFTGLNSGQYQITESSNVGGYQFASGTGTNCVFNDSTATASVTAATTAINASCTFHNAQQTGTIIVAKDVVGPNREDVTDNTFFKVKLDGADEKDISETSSTTYINVSAGTHTITESWIPENYDFDSFSVDEDANTPGAQITVPAGGTANLTITNKQKSATINVYKEVYGTDGTTDVIDDHAFTVQLDGDVNSEKTIKESIPNSYTVNPGTDYSITENDDLDYVEMGCYLDIAAAAPILATNFSLISGEEIDVICNNKQLPAKIKVIKDVLAWDGSAIDDDYEFRVTLDGNTKSFKESAPAEFDVNPGTYSATESAETSYTQYSNSSPVTVGSNGYTEITIENKQNPASISGTKINDATNTGIEDWTINLYLCNDGESLANCLLGAAIDTTTTDANGDYTFSQLFPGLYLVEEVLKTGWINTAPINSNILDLEAGDETEIDFVNVEQGKIIVKKETLPDNDTQEFTFITNYGDNGFLLSDGEQNESSYLTPTNYNDQGKYSVSETVPSGWELTSATCDQGETPDDIDLEPGETVTCIFTNTKKGSITIEKQVLPDGDLTTFDFNGDINDTLGDDEKVSLDVRPGTYTVSETNPSTSGYRLIDITCSDANSNGVVNTVTPPFTGTATFNVEPGEQVTCVFTNEMRGAITAHKFEDINGDGIQNGLDPDIENWRMYLYTGNNCQGDPLSQALTNAQGEKTFYSITANEPYSVKEKVKSGWINTTDICQNVSVMPGETITVDFGNFKLGQIRGLKYHDLNNDGTKDGGEPNLDDWVIRLYQKSGINWNLIQTDVTGNDGVIGQYRFIDLELGKYRVCEVLKDGWIQTSPTGTSNNINSDEASRCRVVEITESSQIESGRHFGNTQLGSISGYKWEDSNHNSIWDSGENEVDGTTISGGLTIYLDLDTDIETQIDENGYFEFLDLTPGDYQVCERDDLLTGWTKTYPTNNNCQTVTVNADEETDEVYFGNVRQSSVTVIKYEDINGNGKQDDNELVLGGWVINLTGQDSQKTDQNGQVVFGSLLPDTYYLSETQKEGWTQTNITCTEEEEPTPTPTPNIGVCHWNEGKDEWNALAVSVDNPGHIGNHEKDYAYGIDPITNEEDPEAPRKENGHPDKQNGADQWCDDHASSNDISLLDKIFGVKTVNAEPSNGQLGYPVTLDPGENVTCTIGNQQEVGELTISKYNNLWPIDQTAGAVINFTIIVKASLNKVRDVKVVDLMPEGFEFNGTWTIIKNGGDITGGVPNPNYASPGEWNLGDMEEGDEITITFPATISEDQDPGLYKDLAYAYGTTGRKDIIYASSEPSYVNSDSGEITDQFVGTQVNLVKDVQDSKSYDVEKEEERIGEVLGVSTMLPGTGANSLATQAAWILLLGSVLSLLFMLRKRLKRVLAIVFVFVFLIGANRVQANGLDALSLRIEQPKSPTNVNTFDIVYTTMDLYGNEITGKCLKKGPTEINYSQFGSATFSGGGSGICVVNSSIMNQSGTYSFKVEATSVSGFKDSIVTVDYGSSSLPATPVEYSKNKIEDCKYRIKGKSADDGKTVKVELYRSDNLEFTADGGSRIHTFTVGPNTSFELDNSVPHCDRDYYYALRAFDAYGNGSDLIGDKNIKVTYTDSTTTETTTTTEQGAIVLEGGAGIAAEGAAAEGEVLSEEEKAKKEEKAKVTTEPEGEVLGVKAAKNLWDKVLNFAKENPLLTIIIIGGLGMILYASVKAYKSGKKS